MDHQGGPLYFISPIGFSAVSLYTFAMVSLGIKYTFLVYQQFSCSVVSDSLRPHGLQRARLPFFHHQLPEPAQTHVHPIGDAIQPSHPLSPASPSAFNLSHHQGLVQ